MNERPAPPALTLRQLRPIPANPRIEANLRRAIMQLNIAIRELNVLVVDVPANAAAIATNITGIADNVTAIATNAGDVATNAANIATNAGNIATNAGDVATNAADIGTNDTELADHETRITTNAGDVATNAAAILDIADDYLTSAYTGSANIVTVGEIGTGTWSADVIVKEKLAIDIDTLGTIGTGIWEGTKVDPDYIDITFGSFSISIDAESNEIGLTNDMTPVPAHWFYGPDGDNVLGWRAITIVGTIAGGTWEADAIDHERGGLEADVSGYAGLVKITGGATSAVTIGIADANVPSVVVADVADNDYAKFTASGLEGRSYAEVKEDLTLDNVENTAVSTWAGTASITTVGEVTTGTWKGTPIADAYIASAAAWNAAASQADTNATEIAYNSLDIINNYNSLMANYDYWNEQWIPWANSVTNSLNEHSTAINAVETYAQDLFYNWCMPNANNINVLDQWKDNHETRIRALEGW